MRPFAISLAAALLAAPAAAAPVVVELFTSQGCSSCPDADALLSRWGGARFAKGEVLPLSFDVDYWNYLGWKDAFSAPAYSRRQRDYAAALGARVYTPQMVVAGREAFVGSDEGALERAAARYAAEAPRARASVTALPSPAGRLRLRVQAARAAPGAGEARLMLALFENGLVTPVASGENAGRDLRADFVVRRLVDLGPLPADGSPLRRAVDERWDPAWSKARGGAAVFVQELPALGVSGAAWAYPLSGARMAGGGAAPSTAQKPL